MRSLARIEPSSAPMPVGEASRSSSRGFSSWVTAAGGHSKVGGRSGAVSGRRAAGGVGRLRTAPDLRRRVGDRPTGGAPVIPTGSSSESRQRVGGARRIVRGCGGRRRFARAPLAAGGYHADAAREPLADLGGRLPRL